MQQEIGLKTANHHFRLGDFEGPLDLLLFLIKKAEVNIYDIPIAHVTEQYLAIINNEKNIGLDNITEFYVMAATLLYIKSKMLLPMEFDFEDEFDDPRSELVERLIDYQKYKEYSKLIRSKEDENLWVIERRKKERFLPFAADDDLWEMIDVWELLRSFSQIVSSLSSETIFDLYEEVSINEKHTLMNELLETKGEFRFTDLITKKGSTMDIVCAFLAILEAVKSRLILVYQCKLFDDIKIMARERGYDG